MSTEGNRPEEALTSSEQELRLLVEAIPALVWRAGPEGNIEYVNQRVLDYLGAPLGEVIGWGWMDKVHPDDIAFKVRTWLENLESGNSHDAACRFRGADSRYRWFEVRGKPLRASDGGVLSWCGVLLDIDDRRKAEEALRESEYKLRQITDTVPGLICSTGPEERHGFLTQLQATLNVIPAYTWYAAPSGGLTFVNKRTADYLGLPKDHPLRFGIDIGAQWDAHIPFLHPDDREGARKAWPANMRTGEASEFSFRVRNAEGGYRWFLSRVEPLRASDGTLLQWVGVNLDIEELKRAEQALRRSEADLAEAQRLSHTGSFGWTPSTGELRWSDEAFRILEYDPSVKPTIERVLERIYPDERAMIRQLIDELSHGEKDFDVTHRLLMPDGAVKFVHVLSHALKDAARNLEVVGALMDVTENTCLYRDLAEREAKIRRLVEANIIGVFIGDFDGRILEANDAFLRIVGYDREDLAAGRINWKDLTPRDWRERDAQWIEEHKRTGVRPPIEKEYFRKDGRRVPVLLGSAAFEEGGNQSVAFVLDLTERKQSEEALRASEEQWKVVFENAPTMYFVVDSTFVILSANPFGAQQLGYTTDELIGRPVEILFHPADREQALRNAAVCLEHIGRTLSWELRKIRKDGEMLWVRQTVKAMMIKNRPVFLTACEDITEGKRAEEALRETQMQLAHANRVATMGQLTASIAHEVNQPIAATVTNAQAALRWLGAEPPNLGEARQALSRIVRDGDRGAAVVQRIRNLAKKATPRDQRVDINAAIREVIELTRSEATKNGVQVQTELASGVAVIQGDRVELQQVILNLILNALEAMGGTSEGARELQIGAETTESGEVLVAVRDSGPGLAPATLEHLFKAFHTTKPNGLGLGLSICRSIIEGHGGRLWASANAPRGAVFQFTLPARPVSALPDAGQ
jgi:PAS domain S-box-containing protein